MQISVYSTQKYDKERIGWHRDGRNISYSLNGIRKSDGAARSFYTLSFIYDFSYTKDTVYFAYSIPYTYTDLIDCLSRIERNEAKSELCMQKTLCRTIAGNRCEYLVITSRSKDALEISKRKGIVMTARVHPGETVGSWMMQGIIDFLTDPMDSSAEILRQNFIFKIIPMLNPDGVINGNYRCSLAGCDLNRRWKKPDKYLHPTVYHTKSLIRRLNKERGLAFFCDFHGHSRKRNSFVYGCNDPDKPEITRIFPMILSKICPLFSFASSRFGVQQCKESTSRVTIFKEMQIPNVFTLEASFLGCDVGEFAGMHMNQNNLRQIGRDVCRALILYFNLDSIPRGVNEPPYNMKMNSEDFKSKIMDELKNNKELIEKGNDENESSGSEDCPSDDNLSKVVLSQLLPYSKKKKPSKNKELADEMKSIFGFGSKKPERIQQPTPKPRIIIKEEKKTPLKPVKPPPLIEPVKVMIVEQPKPAQEAPKEEDSKKVIMVDAWTQTDKIDFARARSKMVMSRFGKSNLTKNTCIFKISNNLLIKLMDRQ